MTGLAVLLVLIAAVAHASWNYLAKKASGGTAFIWLFASLSTLIYFPLAVTVMIWQKPEIGWYQLSCMIVSAVFHCLYFILLDKGYRTGDLSVVYPLARGTGPVLSIIVAILFLEESPSALALAGSAGIVSGSLVISGNPLKLKDTSTRRPLFYALLCGAMIAGYTVWDKVAVSVYLIPPLLMDWSANLGRVLLLTPFALKNWEKVKFQWSQHRQEIIGVSILSPLAYILVLTAMVFSPVSYIAPAREISILLGTIFGARLLAEGNLKLRFTGAGAMVLGLAALSLA